VPGLPASEIERVFRADLLRRLGRNAEAALAYEAAVARTDNATERDFLQRSRQALT
jgi:RNA polymerase sigma-70 factor, ECF subfamily